MDYFLGQKLKDEVLKIMPVQKQTRAGQRTRFKVFICIYIYVYVHRVQPKKFKLSIDCWSGNCLHVYVFHRRLLPWEIMNAMLVSGSNVPRK